MANKGDNKREIKLKAPEVFNGDRSKTNAFISSLNLHFLVNDQIFHTDTLKKAYALSYMTEGTAQPWAQQEQDRLFGDPDREEEPTISVGPTTTAAQETWKEFSKRLRKAFSDVVSKQNAQNKLQTLRQGNQRVDEYVAEFQAAAILSGITDQAALILLFKNGLNKPIRDKMTALLDQPTELIKWFEYTARLDNQWFADKQLYKNESTYGNNNRDNKTTHPTTTTIHAMSQEERDRHFQQNLCFRCHQPGHISKECPNKSKFWKPRPQGQSTDKSQWRPQSRQIREMDTTEDNNEQTEEQEQPALTAQIRAMAQNLNNSDKAEIMDFFMKQDFLDG